MEDWTDWTGSGDGATIPEVVAFEPVVGPGAYGAVDWQEIHPQAVARLGAGLFAADPILPPATAEASDLGPLGELLFVHGTSVLAHAPD